MVSYSAWDKGDSWRQETSRKSFLSGMGQWQIIVAGNCLRMVSHPAWGCGKLSRKETFRQEISRLRFAALEMTGEGKTIVYHCGRELVEKVSYSAWGDGIS